MNITKTIRKEFKTCGESRYSISKKTGISQTILCRIAQGRPCESDTADILLAYFGYELHKKTEGMKK
jgi:hypothetical protein